MRALARNGRGQGGSSGGRLRAFVADPSCPCCDGCPSWRLLAVCDTSPRCDGSPPPILSAWICTSVTCLDGSPIGIGQVVLIDGICWTAQIQTQTVPPEGAYIIAGLDPVQCVSGCDDPACPPPNIWYRGQPCNPANPIVYFCGITECDIYEDVRGCYRVDPSMGGGPLPPGALYANGGTRHINCCTCESGCRVCPLVDGAVNDDECYDLSLANQTCCRSGRACVRLIRYRGTQLLHSGGVLFLTIINEAVNPTTNPDGSVTWQIRQTYAPTGQTPQIQILPESDITYGCGICPTWTFRAPRTHQDSAFTGDGTYTQECRGYPDSGDGRSVVVSGWGNNSYTCDRQVQDVTYTYNETPSQRLIITRFEFEAIIEDDDGGVCAGECIGRGVSAQRRAATGAGCSGCNKNTTRIA